LKSEILDIILVVFSFKECFKDYDAKTIL